MSKENKLKVNMGLKSCDKCEYYLRCEECVGSHYREEMPKLNQRIVELEEQLKNAIVPKFKVGQEVFFKLWDGQEAIGGIIDVQYSTTSGVMYEIQYSDGWESDSDWFEEKDVWSKEAQAKLEELKGENK